ncbi:hypothetical protein NKH18_39945 [Streptomyces sp. M10(2022)]
MVAKPDTDLDPRRYVSTPPPSCPATWCRPPWWSYRAYPSPRTGRPTGPRCPLPTSPRPVRREPPPESGRRPSYVSSPKCSGCRKRASTTASSTWAATASSPSSW